MLGWQVRLSGIFVHIALVTSAQLSGERYPILRYGSRTACLFVIVHIMPDCKKNESGPVYTGIEEYSALF